MSSQPPWPRGHSAHRPRVESDSYLLSPAGWELPGGRASPVWSAPGPSAHSWGLPLDLSPAACTATLSHAHPRAARHLQAGPGSLRTQPCASPATDPCLGDHGHCAGWLLTPKAALGTVRPLWPAPQPQPEDGYHPAGPPASHPFAGPSGGKGFPPKAGSCCLGAPPRGGGPEVPPALMAALGWSWAAGQIWGCLGLGGSALHHRTGSGGPSPSALEKKPQAPVPLALRTDQGHPDCRGLLEPLGHSPTATSPRRPCFPQQVKATVSSAGSSPLCLPPAPAPPGPSAPLGAPTPTSGPVPSAWCTLPQTSPPRPAHSLLRSHLSPPLGRQLREGRDPCLRWSLPRPQGLEHA